MFAIPLVFVIFLMVSWFGALLVLFGMLLAVAVPLGLFFIWVISGRLSVMLNYRNQGTLISFRKVGQQAYEISRNLADTYSDSSADKHPVIVLVPPSEDLVALMLALVKHNNGKFMPIVLNPRVGLIWFSKEIFRIIVSEKSCLVIVSRGFIKVALGGFVRLSEFIGFNSFHSHISVFTINELSAPTKLDVRTSSDTDDIDYTVMVVYTSGSTGLPKPVLFPRKMISAQCQVLSDVLYPDIFKYAKEGECVLVGLTYWMIMLTMLDKDALIPFGDLSQPASISARALKQAIRAHENKITAIFASPVVFQRLCQDSDGGRYKLPSTIRQCVTGGTSISYPLARRINEMLDETTGFDMVYGATEALPISRISLREYLNQGAYKRSMKGWGVCIGRIVGQVKIMIASVDGANGDSHIFEILAEHSSSNQDSDVTYSSIVNDDDISISEMFGEIVVSGDVVSPGYAYSNRNDPWLAPQENDHHHFTGDAGFIDPRTGMIWYGGRVKDLVQFRRMKVPCVCIETIADEIVGTGDRTAFINSTTGQGGILLIENQRGLQVNADLCEWILRAVDETVFKGCVYDIRAWNGRFPSDATHQSKIRRDLLRQYVK